MNHLPVGRVRGEDDELPGRDFLRRDDSVLSMTTV